MVFREQGGPSPEEMGIGYEKTQTPEAREKERDQRELSGELGRAEMLVGAVIENLKKPDAETRISKMSAATRNRLIEAGTFLSSIAAGAGGVLAGLEMAGRTIEHVQPALVPVVLAGAVVAERLMFYVRARLMSEGGLYEEERQETLQKERVRQGTT